MPKINELPAASSFGAADLLATDNSSGTATKKVSGQQIKDYVTADVAADVADLKNASEYRNSANVLDLNAFDGTSYTTNGITYAWDTHGNCTVTGTASPSASLRILYNQTAAILPGISAGDEFYVGFNGTTVYLEVYEYIGSSATLLSQTKVPVKLKLSSSATGMLVRLRVSTNTGPGSTGEVVSPRIYNAVTNKQLEEEIPRMTYRTYYPYSAHVPTFTVDGTTITFHLNRALLEYMERDGTLQRTMINMESGDNLIVPHDSYAICNLANSNALEVKNKAALNALSERDYVILFYNSNGNVRGLFDKYVIDNRVTALQNQIASGISYPSYYDTHIASKSNTINTLLSGITSGDAFVFCTDIHYPDNQMHSPQLINAICRNTSITKVILGGDYINREDLKATALTKINQTAGMYEYADVDTFRVVGNHEFNNPAASAQYEANELSASELRFAMFNTFANKATFDPNTLSYYFDNESQKIRYFVGAVNRSSALNSNSIKWIADQMEETPTGYGVVVIFHTIIQKTDNTVSPTGSAASLVSLLDAAKAKTSVTIDGNTYSYSGKTFDVICAICGDKHMDINYTTSGGVNIIATTTDSSQELGDLTRTTGTTTETAFDVVTINRTTKKINFTRIGAGSDREFTYS